MFKINWERLQETDSVALKNRINNYLKGINTRPDWLGEIKVVDFQLGSKPPLVELVDICDPLSDFYAFNNSRFLGSESFECLNLTQQQQSSQSDVQIVGLDLL